MRIFFVISLYTGLRQRRDWSASARPIRVLDGDRGRVPGRETDFFKATLVFSVTLSLRCGIYGRPCSKNEMFKQPRVLIIVIHCFTVIHLIDYTFLPFVNYVILLILFIYS